MKKFPQRTVTRAFMYLRALDSLIEEGKAYVSSGELAAMTALTDVQIRKDISVFGKAGKPRVGYDTLRLKQLLE